MSKKRKRTFLALGAKKRRVMGRKKYVAKRTYKSRTPRTVTIFKSPSTPWPLNQNLQLRFSTEVRLTHSAVATNFTISKVFRANDIYDPDPAIGGSTVNGHSVYANMYGRYRVFSVRVHLQKVPVSGAANTIGRMWIRGAPSSLPGVISTQTTAFDLPNIPKLSYKGTNVSTGSPSTFNTIKRTYTIDYLEGKRVGADDGYSADFSGNPGFIPHIEVGHTLIDSPQPAEVLFLLVLTYNVRLYEPTISSSTAVAT